MLAGKSKKALSEENRRECTPVIPAQGKLRPEDRTFKVSLNYLRELTTHTRSRIYTRAVLGTGAFLTLPTGIPIIGLCPLLRQTSTLYQAGLTLRCAPGRLPPIM